MMTDYVMFEVKDPDGGYLLDMYTLIADFLFEGVLYRAEGYVIDDKALVVGVARRDDGSSVDEWRRDGSPVKAAAAEALVMQRRFFDMLARDRRRRG